MNGIGAQQRRTEKEAKRKPGRGAAQQRRSSGRSGGGRLMGESSARQRSCGRWGIDGSTIQYNLLRSFGLYAGRREAGRGMAGRDGDASLACSVSSSLQVLVLLLLRAPL